MINVTKPYLPPKEEYEKYLDAIWDNVWLTNQGPLVKQLEETLNQYLHTSNCQFISNGTIALMIALQALDIKDCEVITTPFSFVATTNSIIWQHCKPVFVDIDSQTYNIDCSKIEEKITKKTKAIMAVHVFGNPCDIDKIEEIASKHNIKVIYDGAHAFGVTYKGKSALTFGDITTCSFHATKVFHSVEGGAIISKDDEVNKKVDLLKKFGYDQNDYYYAGINAKNSEFHAAMGLCVFNHFPELIEARKKISEYYDSRLLAYLGKQLIRDNIEYNYIYYPVLFDSEEQLLTIFENLNENGIAPRRYFYPTLNELSYLEKQTSCPVSEDISRRIACLPLDTHLTIEQAKKICDIIVNSLKNIPKARVKSKRK